MIWAHIEGQLLLWLFFPHPLNHVYALCLSYLIIRWRDAQRTWPPAWATEGAGRGAAAMLAPRSPLLPLLQRRAPPLPTLASSLPRRPLRAARLLRLTPPPRPSHTLPRPWSSPARSPPPSLGSPVVKSAGRRRRTGRSRSCRSGHGWTCPARMACPRPDPAPPWPGLAGPAGAPPTLARHPAAVYGCAIGSALRPFTSVCSTASPPSGAPCGLQHSAPAAAASTTAARQRKAEGFVFCLAGAAQADPGRRTRRQPRRFRVAARARQPALAER
jgi:hypothetical protein